MTKKQLLSLLFGLLLCPSLAWSDAPPDIQTLDIKNQPFSLADQKGKVVLLDFWATWCPPCRESLKHYEAIQNRYGTENVKVVAITSEESRDQVIDYVNKLSLSFVVIHDEDGSITEKFQPQTMPTALILNQAGEIVERFEGFVSGDQDKIESSVRRLLGDNTLPQTETPTTLPILPTNSGANLNAHYRYWSYGLWSAGALLLGAGSYIWLGPLQDSIDIRNANYQLWQTTDPSPQFESFERTFLEAEDRAEKQQAWAFLLAGAGLTTVVAGFVTWFSAPIDVSPSIVSDQAGLELNLIPRLNSNTPGLDVYMSW